MADHFEWFDAVEGNNSAKAKQNSYVFEHFGRALQRIPQKKWATLTGILIIVLITVFE